MLAQLDALVTESAVQHAVRQGGHHVAGFGLWALRRQAGRRDVVARVLGETRDWTWLAFMTASPHDLLPSDATLLADLVHRLHGVSAIQWMAGENTLTFTSWPLSTTTLRGRPHLVPGRPAPVRTVPLPSWPAADQELRWPGVSRERLRAALVEATYVEQVAAARPGDFTNIDVVAAGETCPVIVEVKRRTRRPIREGDPLRLTLSQTATLHHLAQVGCEVHIALRIVPPGQASPAQWLTAGRWHAASPVIKPGWTEALVELYGEVGDSSVDALQKARSLGPVGDGTPLFPAAPPVPVILPPQPPLKAINTPARSEPRVPQTPRVKPPRRLTAFTGTYAFLDAWHPVPVRLGGRTYTSAATAFLAAQTLDSVARERLTRVATPSLALQVARRSDLRADWAELRPTVVREILRFAFRAERAHALVSTLPLVLADGEVLDGRLYGLQGRPGLETLTGVRADLARQQATLGGRTCWACARSQPSRWSAFVRCVHPAGVMGTLACVGAAAVQGPTGDAGAPTVPVTTLAGLDFLPSEEAAFRP